MTSSLRGVHSDSPHGHRAFLSAPAGDAGKVAVHCCCCDFISVGVVVIVVVVVGAITVGGRCHGDY